MHKFIQLLLIRTSRFQITGMRRRDDRLSLNEDGSLVNEILRKREYASVKDVPVCRYLRVHYQNIVLLITEVVHTYERRHRGYDVTRNLEWLSMSQKHVEYVRKLSNPCEKFVT